MSLRFTWGVHRVELPNSSTIEVVEYDEDRSELRLWFRDGSAYLYRLVPRATAEALVNATSPGTFFSVEMRGRYPCEKIEAQ